MYDSSVELWDVANTETGTLKQDLKEAIDTYIQREISKVQLSQVHAMQEILERIPVAHAAFASAFPMEEEREERVENEAENIRRGVKKDCRKDIGALLKKRELLLAHLESWLKQLNLTV